MRVAREADPCDLRSFALDRCPISFRSSSVEYRILPPLVQSSRAPPDIRSAPCCRAATAQPSACCCTGWAARCWRALPQGRAPLPPLQTCRCSSASSAAALLASTLPIRCAVVCLLCVTLMSQQPAVQCTLGLHLSPLHIWGPLLLPCLPPACTPTCPAFHRPRLQLLKKFGDARVDIVVRGGWEEMAYTYLSRLQTLCLVRMQPGADCNGGIAGYKPWRPRPSFHEPLFLPLVHVCRRRCPHRLAWCGRAWRQITPTPR